MSSKAPSLGVPGVRMEEGGSGVLAWNAVAILGKCIELLKRLERVLDAIQRLQRRMEFLGRAPLNGSWRSKGWDVARERDADVGPEQDTRNDRRYKAMDTIAMSQTNFVTFGNLKLRKMWLCYGVAEATWKFERLKFDLEEAGH